MEDTVLQLRGQLLKAEATEGRVGSQLDDLHARITELESELNTTVRVCWMAPNV